MDVVIFSAFVTFFGFAPTGLLALGCAIAAKSHRAGGRRRRAQEWRMHAVHLNWISVVIGFAVELPVAATLMFGRL